MIQLGPRELGWGRSSGETQEGFLEEGTPEPQGWVGKA